ncbi:MAG: potassium channel family protein [Chloroflexi bacterium]|nr:potassium channel family protein [Chloroflexota bacterium]
MSLRDKYNSFIARHEIAWELTFAGLAILFVVVGFAEPEEGPIGDAILSVANVGLAIVFAGEFATRFLAAHDRRGYLRGHWVDLVALVPTVRGLRVLRLLRLLRMVRAFSGAYRALNGLDRVANHRGLARLIILWLAVMVVCSVGYYLAENGISKCVTSPLDALWWGIVTLSTVGYGDVYPVTPEGKIFASVLMILGIGLFGAITATMASYLVATQGEREDNGPLNHLRELVSLRDAGVVTPDEFDAKSLELVRRL